MLPRSQPRSIQVVVEFDKTLFNQILGEGGILGWNRYVADLMTKDLVAAAWAPNEPPPPLIVILDLHRLRMRNHRLDGINLALCWLADADFEESSLKGVQMGCCPRASFRNARLHGADFRLVEITGADFTGCLGLETAIWGGAVYAAADPPKGLPDEILKRCVAEVDRPPLRPRQPENPAEPRGDEQAPLISHATIHFVPTDEP